jgi:hypothetical protein
VHIGAQGTSAGSGVDRLAASDQKAELAGLPAYVKTLRQHRKLGRADRFVGDDLDGTGRWIDSVGEARKSQGGCRGRLGGRDGEEDEGEYESDEAASHVDDSPIDKYQNTREDLHPVPKYRFTVETMSDWVPEACTLPTAQQPLRLAELDAMLATVYEKHRLSPVKARLHLTAAPDSVRDLTARETECCSFFIFTVGSGTLDIEVPSAHIDVLEALLERA